MKVAQILTATAVFLGSSGANLVSADGVDEAAQLAALERAIAHPEAPAEGTIFFQNFDNKPEFHLSTHADYVGQDVKVKSIEGRCVGVGVVVLVCWCACMRSGMGGGANVARLADTVPVNL